MTKNQYFRNLCDLVCKETKAVQGLYSLYKTYKTTARIQTPQKKNRGEGPAPGGGGGG